MKKWVNYLVFIFPLLLFPTAIALLSTFFGDSKKEVWFIVVISILSFFVIFLSIWRHAIIFSTKKRWTDWMFEKWYLQKYSGKIFNGTYIESIKKFHKSEEGIEIEFELKIEKDKIIKTQRTIKNNDSNKPTTSVSELKSIHYDKHEITLVFGYTHSANYKESGREIMVGEEIIILDRADKNISSFKYFNNKPAYGEVKDIKVIK